MEENKIQLVRGMLDNLEEILERRYINVYFTDISGSMHTWLRERKLTTRFEDDAMYFRDSNISFSKIDAFVEKRVQFENEVGDIVLDSFSDIVDI
jgi:hypothetical protein